MNKPEFDPNQPFKSEKPEFDPSNPFTGGESPSDTALKRTANVLSNAMQTINMGSGYNGPVNTLEPQGQNLFNKWSGNVAEYLGGKNLPGNPYTAAAVGTLVSLANPENWIGPKSSGIRGRIGEPVIPPEKAFDVVAAKKYGLPMTRADLTGSKAASMVETGLSNTITGSGPIQDIARQKLQAIEAAKEKIGSEFGTSQPLSSSGEEARIAMQSNMGEASQTARDLYKQVPDVPIPTSNLSNALNDIDFQNIDKSALPTINEIRSRLSYEPAVTEGTSPKTFGSSTYQKEIPARTEGVGFTKKDIPSLVQNVPLESQYRIGPINPTERLSPTFQKLNDIRNLLSKEIQSDTRYNPIVGNQIGEKAQALIPLKNAIDADYASYIKASQGSPYGRMESGQFETSFNRANSFYGDLKNLQNNKLVQKLSRIQPSDIPKTIFGPGRIEDVNVAKSVLGQEGFNAAKKQFFNDLLESKNIGNTLNKYEPEFLQGVFNEKELNALKEADSLKRTATTAERIAGNPSGTARVVSSIATGGALADALRRAFVNPIGAIAEGALALGGPRAAVRGYLGTTYGIPYSVSPGITDAMRQSALAEYVSRIGRKGNQNGQTN